MSSTTAPADLFDPAFGCSAEYQEEVARNCGIESPNFAIDPEELRLRAAIAKRMAMDWLGGLLQRIALYLVDQGGRSKLQGAGIRAFVFASAILPSLHGLTQTELGEMLKLHKQSIGRQVSRLRDLFPGVVWGAMQSEAGRQACRDRESRKVDVNFAEETPFEVVVDYNI